MTAGKNRVRLVLEHLEDHCTPSATGGGLAAHSPAHHGGLHEAAAIARASHEHAVPIKLSFQCSADVGSSTVSATGFGTHLGHWTAQGHIDSVVNDPIADRITIGATATVVTANGDQLFVSITASWQISTGLGEDTVVFTGGTGRFAGASGHATLDCTVTGDPASQTFACNCKGSGTLILAHRWPGGAEDVVSSDR